MKLAAIIALNLYVPFDDTIVTRLPLASDEHLLDQRIRRDGAKESAPMYLMVFDIVLRTIFN